MEYTKKIIYQSNYWYNDGLRKAQIRDMSGAITSLRRSLQYNRANIAARNLLGLVFFGRGEVVEALVEWIISKNLQPNDNIASYFINKVQSSSDELEVINQAIKQYNQCLVYCDQGDDDFAIIQLKKAVTSHPEFLKAYQLLALLYLHTEQYAKARQILRTARKIDTTNETTLRYMHELTRLRGKRIKEETSQPQEDSVEYNVGNETIIQPTENVTKTAVVQSFRLKHLLIGTVIGMVIMWFLVVPAVNSEKTEEMNSTILEYSELMNAKDAQISAQKRALDEYRIGSIDADNNSQNAAMTTECYENLMLAQKQWITDGYSSDIVCQTLIAINRDALGEKGAALYDSLVEQIYPEACAILFDSGMASYEVANYDNTVNTLEQVVQMNEEYNDGSAMLTLGLAYKNSENQEMAAKYLKRLIEIFPGSENADEAQSALDEMAGRDTEEDGEESSEEDSEEDNAQSEETE